MKILVILFLVFTFSVKAESILGETRIGFEVTPWHSTDKDLRSYNFKSKQKAKYQNINFQINADYKLYRNLDNVNYGKLRFNPILEIDYFYWDALYHNFDGDKEYTRYNNMLGLNLKINRMLKIRLGYAFIDDSRIDPINAYVIFCSGTPLDTKNYSLGYETFYYKYIEPYRGNEFASSIEVQYKYHILKDWDIYAYSINNFKKEENTHRIDIGFYYYF